jgi:hypothetical protein
LHYQQTGYLFVTGQKGETMLLWNVLVADAKAKEIHRDPEQARKWIRAHLPELAPPVVDERGRRVKGVPPNEEFRWDEEWPVWQDSFEALLWLANRRRVPAAPRSARDRIPLHIQRVIDAVIARTRNAVYGEFMSEAKISVQLSGTFNSSRRFKNLNEFWELAFISILDPAALPFGSFCSWCAKRLPPRKSGQPSRAKLCRVCRVKKWKLDHPEQARAMWRMSKRQERKRTKRSRRTSDQPVTKM